MTEQALGLPRLQRWFARLRPAPGGALERTALGITSVLGLAIGAAGRFLRLKQVLADTQSKVRLRLSGPPALNGAKVRTKAHAHM